MIMNYRVFDEEMNYRGNIVAESDDAAIKLVRTQFKIRYPIVQNMDRRLSDIKEYTI